jgi:hypothetical protein
MKDKYNHCVATRSIKLGLLLLMLIILTSCRTFLVNKYEFQGEKVDITLSYIEESKVISDSTKRNLMASIIIKNKSDEIIEFRFNEMYLSDGNTRVKMNKVQYYNALAKRFLDQDEVITLEPDEKTKQSFGFGKLVSFSVDKGFKPKKIIFDIYGELDFIINEKK